MNGIRFSLFHGENRSIRGADIGLFSSSATGDLNGFQGICGIGRISGDMNGATFSLVNLHEGRDTGVNVGFFNRLKRLDAGANLGGMNLVEGKSAIDVGGLNVTGRSTVQIGILNMTERIDGVQLGFLNVADNGFLPVFPFFNFPTN